MMKLNLRYVIPVMCGTCIALTVSVAAAVGGVSDDGGDIPRTAAATESRVYRAYDFTAPAAYPADGSAYAETADTETAESADITEEATSESGESAEAADASRPSDETVPETREPAETLSEESGAGAIPEEREPAETLTDESGVGAIPEEEEPAKALTEENGAGAVPEEREPAEVLSEKSGAGAVEEEQTEETTPETDKPAEETAGTGYDDPNRQAMLDEVNAVRAEYGLTALSEMPALSEIAQQRARECSGFFSHTRPNGTRWDTLLSDAGLKRNVRAENIAYYYPTARQALNSWMSDRSHRENVLNAEAAYIGIGYCNDGNNAYWVQIFLGE